MTSKELLKLVFVYSSYVEEKVQTKFLPLSNELLNRKPGPQSWSAAECFEHLLHTNELYFPIFQSVLDNMKNETLNSETEFKHTFIGKIIIKSVDPEQSKKYKSPKVFRITASEVRDDVCRQFLKQHEWLLAVIKKFEGADFTKIKIVSPASMFVRYNLGDCLLIIAYHNKRHILQAERAVASLSNQ